MMLRRRGLLAFGLLSGVSRAEAEPLRVGADKRWRSIAAAVRAAAPGSRIEIDAGNYPGDVALLDKDRLSLRAVGGRVVLAAAGRHVEGKGSLVVRAQGVELEGIDFHGARVPDRNGAGIRFDRGSLLVRDCGFFDNEAGLLAGNEPDAQLRIERCEFARNGIGDGYTHQLYAGTLRSLAVVGSYFHQGRSGQHIKSRAARSEVLYNRVTDEEGGRASYELEFPNGGEVLVMGNLVQQSASTENRTLVSFGAEGYRGARHTLRLVHNSLDDRRRFGGRFLTVRPGPVQTWAYNNLLLGGGGAFEEGMVAQAGNLALPAEAFADLSTHDYRLRSSVAERLQAAPLPAELRPSFEYRHPRQLARLAGAARFPGALQTHA